MKLTFFLGNRIIKPLQIVGFLMAYLSLTGCIAPRYNVGLETPYGMVGYDGKTIKLVARAGYAK